MEEIAEHLPAISRALGGLVLAWIFVGVWNRHRPRVHIPILLSAFVIDVLNVLVIELNRDAIQKSIDTATHGGDWILKFHVTVSVIAVLCYLVALGTGPVILRRPQSRLRRWHRRNAGVFLAARTLNFITSFWV